MKLKHRISSTIIMIAFATTNTLQAVTIPQMKRVPVAVKAPVVPKVAAAPKAPVVKVPSAPKIPSAPKNISTPKVPVVKVPTITQIPAVKMTATPKIPKTIQVPVVKTPSAPKLPNAPKIVKIPAKPVQIRTPQTPKVPQFAPKTPVLVKSPSVPQIKVLNSGKQAAGAQLTVKNSPSKIAASAIVKSKPAGQISGLRQAVKDAKNNNPQNIPDVGVTPDLPGLPARDVKIGGRPTGGKTPGTGERTVTKDLFDTLTGKGGKSSGGLFGDVLPKRDVPVLQDINQNGRSFDQGFANRPDVSGFNPDALNPMNGVNNNGIGGPLGDAARAAGNGTPGGLAGMGNSLISDAATDAANKAQDDIDTGASIALDTVAVIEVAAEMGKLPVTAIFGGGGAGAATVATAVGGVTTAASLGITVGTLIDTTYQSLTGSSIGADWADMDQKLGLGIGQTTVAAEDAVRSAASGVKGLFGQPDPENEGAVDVDIYTLAPGIAQQVGQSRLGKKGSQGGNGDVKPADDSANGALATGVEISATHAIDMKNSLVGNPGQRGVRESSSNSATPPARSNGSGTITPTDDQNTATSGGRQEDPGEFLGNGVGPDQSRLNGGDNSDDSSSSNSENSSSSSGSESQSTKKKK